jgi:phosphopantothenate-cysteine ligase
MKILITAGGTREYIDSIRIMTNISTGKLAAEIVLALQDKLIDELYYVCAKGSFFPQKLSTTGYPIHFIEVTDVNSLMKVMEELVPKVDVVIHSMAVSDFGFKPIPEKLKSNSKTAFIKSIQERIYINPKVISFVKKWNPNVKLVGFKFEVGKSHTELIKIAKESMIKNDCDFVVANDKQEMKESGTHRAYILDRDNFEMACVGKTDIANKLVNLILKN